VAVAGYEYVGGLDVAMDDAHVVGGVQSFGDLYTKTYGSPTVVLIGPRERK
jgi:hypothetical protein